MLMLLVGLLLQTPAGPPASGSPDIRNFLQVDADFCTGGQPRSEHFAMLRTRGVKAVLNLRTPAEYPIAEEEQAVRDAGLAYFNIPVVYREPKPEQLDEFLKITDDPANRPLFIHCTAAIRVGAFWLARRVLRDGWTWDAALAEARKVGLTASAGHLETFVRQYIAAHPTDPNRPAPGRSTPLFDGRTLDGWQGDPAVWRVEDGALTGGTPGVAQPVNEFLATTREFSDFVLRLQIKLTGTEGFVNSGVQIRSQRKPNSSEMIGYQCDFGDPDWWGGIYDESRRDRVLAAADMATLGPAIRRGDWNEYVIRAEGPRIRTWINGVLGVDFRETDPAIPLTGGIGIQLHSGGKAVVQVRNVTIEEIRP